MKHRFAGPQTPREYPSLNVIHLRDPRAGALISALGSETARQIYLNLRDASLTASELSDELSRSLQTIQYHLRRLEERDLVEVSETTLSEKGRRMDAYAPAEVPSTAGPLGASPAEPGGIRDRRESRYSPGGCGR